MYNIQKLTVLDKSPAGLFSPEAPRPSQVSKPDLRRCLPAGSISNIDDGEYQCPDGTIPQVRNQVNQVISGVVGAASSVTSIQVANLLRLFKIPQVGSDSASHGFP